jgi:flagellin
MPTAVTLGGRIRTNISAEMAYNSITNANSEIVNSRLRLSSGKRINSAADDVAGYISSKSLYSRKTSLEISTRSAAEAKNVASIVQDSLDNIHGLLTQIRDAATLASSASIGTDEKVALAQSSYRFVQQIDLVQNSSVFSGTQLLDGNFNADWVVGFDAGFSTQTISINLTSNNLDLNVKSANFNLTALNVESGSSNNFAGVTGLDLSELTNVNSNNLGVFSNNSIESFITGVSEAMKNITNVAAYVGAIDNRLSIQIDNLNSQITNYSSAVSRIEDSDVAAEQLNLSKQEFLQQSSLIGLSQANAGIVDYFRLLA